MSRQERQLDELRAQCQCGSVSRAVDLAYLHFADFGRNEAVLDLLAETIARTAAPAAIQRRFLDLQLSNR